MARFSLTRKHLSTEQGRSLLRLLMDVTNDGHLTDDEVRRIQEWIDDNGEDLPASNYLRQVLDTILADGHISFADRWDLLLAIEKVIPPEERVLLKMRTRGTPEPATPRQLEYLRMLHVRYDDDLTKEQAAELIDEHRDRNARKKKGSGSTKDSLFGLLIVLFIVAYCANQMRK